jgi:PAS domain S-box-containing protein
MPIVVLTGQTDEEIGLKAVAMGAQDYLVKGSVDEVLLERSLKHSIQRKKMMEELKESNERYVSLFQENHAIMVLVDPVDAKVVDVNQAAIDFSGYPKENFLGMSITDIIVLPSDKVFEDLGKSLSGVLRQFEFKARLANNQVKDVEVYAGPLHIKGKSYLYGIVHDITARKEAEEERAKLVKEVAEQKGLLQTTIDNSPSGILVVSGQDLRIMSANGAFSKLAISVPENGDLVGSRLDELSSNLAGVMVETIRSALATGKPIIDKEIESVAGREPAAVYYLSALPIPLRGDEKGVMIQLSDVTEIVMARRRIEEMAARSDAERRRIKTILDNLPVGVFVVDKNGSTIEKNDNMDMIWGGRIPSTTSFSDYRDFKGWWADTGMIVRPEEWPISRAVKKGEAAVGEVVDIQRFDGTRGTILTSASPIRDSNGKIIGAVGVFQDITRQRKLEHDAIEAKEQAELYIDLLSHDISNMNAAVVGYLESALEKMDIEQKNRQYFTKPQEILENSNRLIENVRKIQQVETHEAKHGLVDLGWLIEDVRSDFEHNPDREIKITYKTAIKKFVVSSDLLRDVFSNIISNAIKHSTGPLEISIVLTKVFEGGREHYKVTIEDDGPGIPDELKSKLFQRKQRGKTKTTGTGLCLYLVKKLVEDVNGRVWVEDRVPGDHSKGARFVVLLPAAYPSNS